MTTRYTIIIPAILKSTLNDLVKDQFDRAGGENTFSVGLSSDGENITHFWASFVPSQEIGAQIEGIAAHFDGVMIFKDVAASEILTQTGLAPWSPVEDNQDL